MADPGWYPDTNSPGIQRYWDGTVWTDHTAPLPNAAPPGPAPMPGFAPAQRGPRLRADGSVKGPSLFASLAVVFAGVALIAVSLFLIVPAFIDTLSGPQWQIPGSHEEDLDTGTWMIYERVGFGGGFGTVGPADVTVDGPAAVRPRQDSAFTETLTINGREYLGVVRFDIEDAGTYQITVRGEPSSGGEVLLARPLTSLGSYWPWFVAVAVGGLVIVGGIVMAIVGGTNRGRAKRVGHPV